MIGLDVDRRTQFKNDASFNIRDGMSMLSKFVANPYRNSPTNDKNLTPTCGPSDRISEEIHDKILSNDSVVLNDSVVFRDSITNKSIKNLNNLIDISGNISSFDFEDQMLIASCRSTYDNSQFQFDTKDTHPYYLDRAFQDISINWYQNTERFTKYVPDNNTTQEKRTRLKRLLYIKNNQDEIIGHSASIVDVFPGQWLLPPLPIDGAPKSITSTFRELKPIFKNEISCSWRTDGTPLFLCTNRTSLGLTDPDYEEAFPFSSLTMNDMLFMTHISAMDEVQARVNNLFQDISRNDFYGDGDGDHKSSVMPQNGNLPDIWVRRSIVINIIVANYIYYKTLLHTAQSVKQDSLLKLDAEQRHNHYCAIKLLGKLYVNKFRVESGSVRSVIYNHVLNHSVSVKAFINEIRNNFTQKLGDIMADDEIVIGDLVRDVSTNVIGEDIDIICDQGVVAKQMIKVDRTKAQYNGRYLSSRSENRENQTKQFEKNNMIIGMNNIFNNYINVPVQASRKNIKRIMWSTIKYLGDKSLYVTATHGQELQKKYLEYVREEKEGGRLTPVVKGQTERYYDRVLNFLRQKLACSSEEEGEPQLEDKEFNVIIDSQKWSLLLSERPQFIRSMMSVPKIDRVLMDGVKIVKHLNSHVEATPVNEYIDISDERRKETYDDISGEFHKKKGEINNMLKRLGLDREILPAYDIETVARDLVACKKLVEPLKIIIQGLKLEERIDADLNNTFIFNTDYAVSIAAAVNELSERIGMSRSLDIYCAKWASGRFKINLNNLYTDNNTFGDNYKYRLLLEDLKRLGIIYENIVQMKRQLNSIAEEHASLSDVCYAIITGLDGSGNFRTIQNRFIVYSGNLFSNYFNRENKKGKKGNEDIEIILKKIADCSQLVSGPDTGGGKQDGSLTKPIPAAPKYWQKNSISQYTLSYFYNFLKKLELAGKIYNIDSAPVIELAMDFIDNINIPDEKINAVINLLKEMVFIVNDNNSVVGYNKIKKILCVGPIYFYLDDKNECFQVELKEEVVKAIRIYRMILNRSWDEEEEENEEDELMTQGKILENFQNIIDGILNNRIDMKSGLEEVRRGSDDGISSPKEVTGEPDDGITNPKEVRVGPDDGITSPTEVTGGPDDEITNLEEVSGRPDYLKTPDGMNLINPGPDSAYQSSPPEIKVPGDEMDEMKKLTLGKAEIDQSGGAANMDQKKMYRHIVYYEKYLISLLEDRHRPPRMVIDTIKGIYNELGYEDLCGMGLGDREAELIIGFIQNKIVEVYRQYFPRLYDIDMDIVIKCCIEVLNKIYYDEISGKKLAEVVKFLTDVLIAREKMQQNNLEKTNVMEVEAFLNVSGLGNIEREDLIISAQGSPSVPASPPTPGISTPPSRGVLSHAQRHKHYQETEVMTDNIQNREECYFKLIKELTIMGWFIIMKRSEEYYENINKIVSNTDELLDTFPDASHYNSIDEMLRLYLDLDEIPQETDDVYRDINQYLESWKGLLNNDATAAEEGEVEEGEGEVEAEEGEVEEAEDPIYDGDFLISNHVLSAVANTELGVADLPMSLFSVMYPGGSLLLKPNRDDENLLFSILSAGNQMEKYLMIRDYKKNSIKNYLTKEYTISYLNINEETGGGVGSKQKRPSQASQDGGMMGGVLDPEGADPEGADPTQPMDEVESDPIIFMPIAEYVDTQYIISNVIFYPNENRKMYNKYLIRVLLFGELFQGDGKWEEPPSRGVGRLRTAATLPKVEPGVGRGAGEVQRRGLGWSGGMNAKKTKKNRRIKKNTKRNKRDKRNKSRQNKTRRKKVKGKKTTIKKGLKK